MNSGKLCISVCASSADDMRSLADKAYPNCDLVELRLDCLNELTTDTVAWVRENTVLTLRPVGEGGNRDLSPEDRMAFWAGVDVKCGADIEMDLIERLKNKQFAPLICSFHDHARTPDVEAIFDKLKATGADVIKIAVMAHDAIDTIDVWRLLDRAAAENRKLVAISMGEAGRSTRILALARGAYMTIAPPDLERPTAPGQIAAGELSGVYRVKELDRDTKVYGIIAGDTSYSMSPYIHNAAFGSLRMNSVFVPFQVADLNAFIRRMVREETREVDLNFHGFSVTNPHKQSIIPFLDNVEETAAKMGAVNTVKIDRGRLIGYNTDAEGFIAPLKRKYGKINGANVAVIGAGGAARACAFALVANGANVSIVARSNEKARALKTELNAIDKRPSVKSYDLAAVSLSDHDIVVNTTPLGTRGEHVNESIANAEQLDGVKLVYDLVYNPAETRLLHEAKRAGAETLSGFDMLIAQAAEQFAIWTGHTAPVEEMAAAARKKLDEG
jgi:3-dehydroquinate dehydratase/shikimate dehydrogenase